VVPLHTIRLATVAIDFFIAALSGHGSPSPSYFLLKATVPAINSVGRGGVRRCPGAKKRIFSPEKPEDTGPLTYFNDKMARRNMGKRLAENA
jgi:hypothetical protein